MTDSGERFQSTTVSRVLPNYGLLAVALAPVLIVALVPVWTALGPLGVGLALGALAGVAAGFLAGFKAGRHGARGAAVPLAFDRQGVWEGGRLAIPRTDFDNAVTAPDARGDGVLVLLGKGGWTRSQLRARDAAEAEAVVRALGLDAARSVMVYKLMNGSPLGKLDPLPLAGLLYGAGVPLTVALVALLRSPWGVLPVALAHVAFVAAMVLPTTVVVGADGVLVRWAGLTRFCAFADVARVEALGTGVRLHRKDGACFDVVVGRPQLARTNLGPGRNPALDRDAIIARIEQAMRVRAATPAGALDPAALARNGRALPEWIGAVRALLDPVRSPREAAVSPEDFWRLVEDVDAPADTRAAAAVALAPSLDERGRQRLRVAAEAVASPRLRVVLEASADGRDEAAHEALGEVSASATR